VIIFYVYILSLLQVQLQEVLLIYGIFEL